MAKLEIDISGRRGLLEGFQGDMNETSTKPQLRYLGDDGQFAEGIFNPLRSYGYLSPANAKYLALSGTIADNIISIQYDSEDDIIYLAENGENILQLAGLDDTSVANHLSVTTGHTITDMLLYEIEGGKALLYAKDTGGSMVVGFDSLGSSSYGIKLYSTDLPVTTAANSALIYAAGSATVGSDGRQLAQRFDSDFLGDNLIINGAKIRVKRSGGTGVGITMRISIRAAADRNDAPYTDRGAWSGAAVAYAVLDTVSRGGTDWICYSAHSSGATTEPGVGVDWVTVWQRFNAPTPTDLAYGDFLLSDIGDGTGAITTYDGFQEVFVQFNTPITLTAATDYWICLAENGSNMGASDSIQWLSTNNGNTLLTSHYAQKYINTLQLWANTGDPGDAAEGRTLDFSLHLNQSEDWSYRYAVGGFTEESGLRNFFFLSENALLYWFVGNKVHAFDGGITGGSLGRAMQDLLQFPSYLEIADVAETRSQMYIGLHDTTFSSDNNHYGAREAGIFIWDRSSQVFGGTDFYPAMGAKEIKSVFVSGQGDVLAITVNDAGYSEIRGVKGNQYGVLQTFERLGYPTHRRGIITMNGLTIWTGKNGIKYAYGAVAPGEPEQLYKIGDESGEYGTGVTQGAIYVGHENSSVPQTAVLTAWTDNGGSKIKKWYPHGVGTIGGVAQTGNQGNVFTKVYDFGAPIHVEWGHIFFVPVSGSSSTDTVATIKLYFNKSSTVSHTFVITKKDLAKGYFYMPIGEKNVFTLQAELEWSTTETLGSFDFQPNKIVVDYNETIIKKK